MKEIGKIINRMGMVSWSEKSIGTYHFANGDKYTGEFVEGKIDGRGNVRVRE